MYIVLDTMVQQRASLSRTERSNTVVEYREPFAVRIERAAISFFLRWQSPPSSASNAVLRIRIVGWLKRVRGLVR